jgi:hypothetical protein
MCKEHSISEQHPMTSPKLASITTRVAHELPRDILNCILTTSAVHYAARDPQNQAIGRLALEMKAGLFEGMSNTFQQPQRQRADVLFTCITLMFAIDVGKHAIYPFDLALI